MSVKGKKGYLVRISRNNRGITTLTIKTDEISQEEMDSISRHGEYGPDVEFSIIGG